MHYNNNIQTNYSRPKEGEWQLEKL